MAYHHQSKEETMKELVTSQEGLTQKEAKERLEKYGFNELRGREKEPLWKLIAETFRDPMVIVLLVVIVVQLFLGKFVDSAIILLVLLMNSFLSVWQTQKAESSLESLKKIVAPLAKVFRDGEKMTVETRNLVVGDIVSLDAGDFVPADGRIISCETLRAEEGMLTGESEAVEKTEEMIEGEATLGDRKNMLYSGSLIVYGRGAFVVTATGAQTQIGKIAELLETTKTKQTPLQKKLDVFSKKLGIAILILCVGIFFIQVSRLFFGTTGGDFSTAIFNSFMFAVAVAVAAIPEALSSIVTIVLAVGTNKMAKQHAIMRKIPAVETLGSTSVICTDKTGTLTQNKMTVVDYFLPEGRKRGLLSNPDLWNNDEKLLIQTAVLCNDASINEDGLALGDPTEVALIRFSDQNHQPYQMLRDAFPRLAELPFDSERKLMSTLHSINGKKVMLTKGGADVLFARCQKVSLNGKNETLSPEIREQFSRENEQFSHKALRVLAYAYKELPEEADQLDWNEEQDLILIGLTALIDPPRKEVYHSIEEAKKAGIKTVMITGDHKTTARAIALDIGLMDAEETALTGQELDAMSDEELETKLEKISVYARVSPENKIRIVRAWQKKGHVTAMTGDGVNDAPALKQADIGIAMGSGTDVAKDASAMILTDDHFASIVNAVAIGRTVFDNIKKAIAYLFSGNLGAIFAIVFALLADWVSPFTALQILFINLVNDSIPAIALGMEESEPNVMERNPRAPNEGIFSDGLMATILVRSVFIATAAITAQYIGMQISQEMGVAMAFTTLISARTLQAFTARSNTQTIVELGFFSNKYVFASVILCSLFYFFTVLPFTRAIFSIPLAFGIQQWSVAVGLAFATVVFMELAKVFQRLRKL